MNSNDSIRSGKAQPPIGIDLGTTYSVVAYVDSNGRPTTIPNEIGDLLTPSAVAFEDGEVIVGKEAVKGSVITPGGFADCFKRDMGQLYFRRTINGQEVPPEVLNAFLLERLKQDAERRIGPFQRVVITVPAFFDETRRKATQDAGRLAGLEVLDIINEPTAAAVAFGYQRAVANSNEADRPAIRERLLVYDLGGGTFDVSILDVSGSSFRTLATDGDVQLGGKDFDQRLVNHIAEKFMAAHGIDPRGDPHDAAQLWLDAQDAKHTLTERKKATVVCSHAGIRMRIEITRDEFEEMNRDLLERTQSTTSLLLRQTGLDWGQIDRILLVGGATRMPMVYQMLQQLSGQEPDRSQSADEAVAHGAALCAAMLESKGTTRRGPNFELINVNSHSLGIVGRDPVTGQPVNSIVIPKNTPLPYQKQRKFQTALDDQRTVKVPVVEGESRRPEHCIALGECIIRNLPPGLPKGSQIDVEYRYAANGRISISARVPQARQSAHVEIEHQQNRNFHDLAAWRKLLLGTAAVAGSADSTPNRAAVMRQLDNLFVHVGERCGPISLAEPLRKSQQLALAAMEEVRQAMLAMQRAEGVHQAAVSAQEAAASSSVLARARQALSQAETKSRFACMALGRSCIEASVSPPGSELEIVEIRRLQSILKGFK